MDSFGFSIISTLVNMLYTSVCLVAAVAIIRIALVAPTVKTASMISKIVLLHVLCIQDRHFLCYMA
jgi:hypothetical protein